MSVSVATIRQFQEQLLVAVKGYFLLNDQPLTPRVTEAFRAVPRHAFVERYRTLGSQDWQPVTAEGLALHLPALYQNDGLGIAWANDDEHIVTISVPSMVLLMLEWLSVESGHRVFEVGAGSGWNAALLGHLAGPSGEVESLEIVPALAEHARRSVGRVGLANVRVVAGDAGLGPASEGSFDRVIFTAGAHDLPAWMHERVHPGGRVLLVLKLPGPTDILVLLRREADHFASIAARAVEFVPMTGVTRHRELDPIPLEDFPPWSTLRDAPGEARPFWCGGGGRASLHARTQALRTYLALVEPRMRWFAEPEGWPHYFFGLHDERTGSLALVRDDSLTPHGGPEAADALMARLHDWVDLGMPGAAGLEVRAYATGQAPAPRPGEFVMRRTATEFLWRMARPRRRSSYEGA